MSACPESMASCKAALISSWLSSSTDRLYAASGAMSACPESIAFCKAAFASCTSPWLSSSSARAYAAIGTMSACPESMASWKPGGGSVVGVPHCLSRTPHTLHSSVWPHRVSCQAGLYSFRSVLRVRFGVLHPDSAGTPEFYSPALHRGLRTRIRVALLVPIGRHVAGRPRIGPGQAYSVPNRRGGRRTLPRGARLLDLDRKSTRLNSSH